MYLIVIAWLYVVLMMSVAEATNSTGTVLGAVVTFLLYGVGPAALVAYLMGTPARNRKIKQQRAEEVLRVGQQDMPRTPPADWQKTASTAPDAGGQAAGGAEAVSSQAAANDSSVAPVRKEP
jgi:hypothetical protein